jgi:putative transposase
MLVLEAKIKGRAEQFEALDEAMRTFRFVQNSCLRYWMDNSKVSRNDLYKYCKVLADNADFPWAVKPFSLLWT